MSLFQDPDFQLKLLAFVCRDINFLRDHAHLLEPDDFKPARRDGPQEPWVVATTALEFYQKYREPIAGMLRVEMLDYARKNRLGDRQKNRLLELVQTLRDKTKLVAVDALSEKVIEYKKERLKLEAVTKLTDLMESGDLTDDRWLQICMDGINKFGKHDYTAVDYLNKLEDRIFRRTIQPGRKNPYFLIDPLDELIKGISRGMILMFLAPWAKGKSLALIHMDMAYLLQGLNVLHITLEDPMDLVEDRLDAAISCLPIKRLDELPKKLRKRFAHYKKLLRSQMRIIDGTDGGISVARIVEFWEREYNRGFCADVVTVDYDDEIKPARKQEQRRHEFADIYRDMRKFAAEKNVYLCTAAQTGRDTEDKKVISGKDTAEDISKVRKVALAVGIGQGEWGQDSRYLNVARHKFDRQHVGCHIMSDLERSSFYDREATLARQIEEYEEKEKKDGEVEAAEE